MAFPKALLAEHETVLFDLRPHWIAILPPVLWTLVGIGVLLGGYTAAEAIFEKDPTGAKAFWGALITALWIWLALMPFLRWRFTMFVLTSDRLITRSGIVAKNSKEIPLERINDVAFAQSVLERVLGAGDLMIESAGERGQTRIANVRRPEQVQLMIYKATEENSARAVSGQFADLRKTEWSVPEQIEALARLQKQGVLTEAEFETKKAELLRRM
jgi:uncharacterized membrane protein YdbT with pleckstrin-like domain